MMQDLNGETRLFPVVGDPIAQVKSPPEITRLFVERGVNAVCVPMHVPAGGFLSFFEAIRAVGNVGGLIVTVPHKFDAAQYATVRSRRTAFLGAANVLRRDAGTGAWAGEMIDGIGFVSALAAEFDSRGRRALLVGAGGAGSAIALALIEAGLRELAIHDTNGGRRDALVARLAGLGEGAVRSGSGDPSGFDLVVNATPLGMRPGDPLPLEAARLAAPCVVADVVAVPAVTPLLRHAREAGCRIQTGGAMFAAQSRLIADFLLGGIPG